MKKTLYVSDLDGTLLQPDASVSERTRRLLNYAISQGALFTIATARTPATVRDIIEGIDMRLPAIVMTGAALWNTVTHAYSDIKYMNVTGVEELVGIYRKEDCPTFLYTLENDMIHIYHIGGLSPLESEFLEERRHNFAKCAHVPDSGDSILPCDLSKTILFYGILPEAKAESTYRKTKEVSEIRAQKYHDFYGPEIGILEAFSPLATKAIAIRRLAESLGVERIVAFGDNLNDLPMLELADVGVAMSNGLDEVKAAADVVIGRNTEDSVAEFIVRDMSLDPATVLEGI